MYPARLFSTLLLLVAPSVLISQGDVTLIRGATIHPASGAPIVNGSILIRDGKIAAIGASVAAPAGARIIEAAGKDVIPGMIDNHSHIGAKVSDLNDSPMLIGPQHRFIDALDLGDTDFNDAVSGGVTTIVTGPGSGENVSGMAIVIKTFGDKLDQRLLLEKGGMKFAMGAKSRDRYPTTTMGVAANLRQYLIRTQEYMATQKKFTDEGQKGAPPARDLGYEAMTDVLTYPRNGPLMIEGYAGEGTASQQYLLGRRRAVRVQTYVVDRFHLKLNYVGVISMGAEKAVGTVMKEGVAIVSFYK